MSITVTFDSNVWEIIVDEDKREISDSVYTILFKLINSGSIIPYFFEGLATMETVRKIDRKAHISNYKSGFTMSVDGEVVSSADGSGGPIISDYLNRVVPKALELGFRFTCLPRIGAPKLNIPEEYWAPDENFDMDWRQKRSFECAEFIESLGSGKEDLMDKLPLEEGGLVQKTKTNDTLTDRQYSKAFAEWVDGDALAANYGYGINYFCTNDRASGAGTTSIFHPSNLSQLEEKFEINVISPEALISKLNVSGS